MRAAKEAAGLLMLGVILGAVLLGARQVAAASPLHWGAPALVYPCPAGSRTVTWWVPASSPQGRGAPGTLIYHGQREIASCAASVTITGG